MANENQGLDAAPQQPLDEHPRPRRARPEAPRGAAAAAAASAPDHECTPTKITKKGSNGDEDRFKGPDGKPDYIGNFSKGLPHDEFGEVKRDAYKSLLHAVDKETDFDKIILKDPDKGRKLTNPQSGLATDQEGPDPKDLKILAAPSLDSAEEAAEGVELYWMALLRDVPFTDFATNPDVAAAAAELSGLTDYTGPKIGGKVTPQTIFRGCEMGDLAGPLLSQYLLHDIGYGSLTVNQRQQTVLPGKDYLTKFDEWLQIQNGFVTPVKDALDPTPRYIRNMRDIGQYVHVDALYQAYLNACLILLDSGAPFDSGNPYVKAPMGEPPHLDEKTQIGFGTFGGPHILSLVTEVATRALKAVWWQKWFVHRRLRPEAYGGLIQVKLEGVGGTKKNYPIHPQILNSEALKRTRANPKFNSYLLPMAFPEGSPTHPAYGAGHATVAGACVTILKAWFDEDAFLVRDLKITPKVPNADGTALVDYTGPDAGSLTVGGELNKVAANIAIARNMAGVHWRSDYQQSVYLGERVALHILRKQRHDYHEKDWSFTLRRFDGTKVTISRKGIFDENGHSVDL
jgi:hypothetical protein